MKTKLDRDLVLAGLMQLEDDCPRQSDDTSCYPNQDDDLATRGRAQALLPREADRVAAFHGHDHQRVDRCPDGHALQVRDQLADHLPKNPCCRQTILFQYLIRGL